MDNSKKRETPAESIRSQQRIPIWGSLPFFCLIQIGLFSLFFGWFLAHVADSRLIFQSRDKLFLWNMHYFCDFTAQPGALLEWMDGLLVQLCYHGWPGALVLAALVGVLLFFTVRLMDAFRAGKTVGTWVIPGWALIWLYADYKTHTALLTGSLLALIAAKCWIQTVRLRAFFRFILFILLSITVYYVAGELALYSFSACVLVYSFFVEKRAVDGAKQLVSVLIVRFGVAAALRALDLSGHYYQPPALDAFNATPPDGQELAFFSYFPICALVMILSRSLWKKKEKEENAVSRFISSRMGMLLRGALGAVLVLVPAYGAGVRGIDHEAKALLEIDYCAEHQQWDRLLEKARALPSGLGQNSYINHDINLALYHTGRLPYQLFSFKQSPKLWALIDYHQLQGIHLIRIPLDFYLEMGRVNSAEHFGLEMVEMWPSGAAYKRMALVKMIKNQPEAAKLYLNNLRDDLVWGRWAEDYLKRLSEDPDLSEDVYIQQARRLMIDEDDLMKTVVFSNDGTYAVRFAAILQSQLERNSQNKMAFEYLMTYSLLTGNLNGVASLFPLLNPLDYPQTPSLYEEAVMMFGLEHPDQITVNSSGVYFAGRRMSDSTVEKFIQLKGIVNQSGGFNRKAQYAVSKMMPGSYFQFYVTSRSGGEHE